MNQFLRFFSGYLLQIVPFSILCTYPLLKHASSKRRFFLLSLLLQATLAAVFTAGCFWIQIQFPPSLTRTNLANVFFLITLVPLFLFFFLCIRDAWYRKLFFTSHTMLSALITTSLANFIYAFFGFQQPKDQMPYSLAGNMCIFLVTVIVLPGFLMAEIKIDHILRNSFSKTGYFSMCFLSIILFVMLGTGLIFVDFIYMSNPLTIFLFICVCILTFATYGIYVRIIQETHQKLEAQNQIHHIQTQLAATKEHYQWIIRMNEYSKKIQHDFRHHMVILNGFLEQEDYAQAFDYITQYIRSTTPFSYIHFCSNQVVDILLNHYRAQCNSQKIDFRVQSVPVNLAPPSGCEDIQSSDLSVIIGNLLENAMTAASKVPPTQAFIQIGICLKGNTLVIWVDNSFDGMINLKEGEYQSTKNDHAAIGLKSIRLLTEKYFGGTEFRHEERIFHASVMLQYPALDGSLS